MEDLGIKRGTLQLLGLYISSTFQHTGEDSDFLIKTNKSQDIKPKDY